MNKVLDLGVLGCVSMFFPCFHFSLFSLFSFMLFAIHTTLCVMDFRVCSVYMRRRATVMYCCYFVYRSIAFTQLTLFSLKTNINRITYRVPTGNKNIVSGTVPLARNLMVTAVTAGTRQQLPTKRCSCDACKYGMWRACLCIPLAQCRQNLRFRLHHRMTVERTNRMRVRVPEIR